MWKTISLMMLICIVIVSAGCNNIFDDPDPGEERKYAAKFDYINVDPDTVFSGDTVIVKAGVSPPAPYTYKWNVSDASIIQQIDTRTGSQI